MASRKVMNAVRYLRERVEANGVHVNRMVLFGSHAKGVATKDSDIDVVIISEDFRRKNLSKRVEMTWRAEREAIKKLMVPFDIVTMTPEEYDRNDTIISDYAHEGKVVYAA